MRDFNAPPSWGIHTSKRMYNAKFAVIQQAPWFLPIRKTFEAAVKLKVVEYVENNSNGNVRADQVQ